VNTKYGAGSYDSLNSSLKAIQAKQNAPATLQAQVTPAQANIGGTIPTPVAPTGMASATSGIVEQATQPSTPVQPVQPTQAPIVPPATPTPVSVEKTTTTTPQGETVVKKETPAPDMKQIQDTALQNRQTEILGNLNEGYKNSPDLFQNQDTFRNAYGYE